MKSTKKILAAFLSAMMVLAMVPFTASAAVETVANDCEITLTSETEGFIFNLFKVATVDIETGEMEFKTTNTNVQNALKVADTTNAKAQNVIAALQTAETKGVSVGSYDSKADGASKTFTGLESGIYFAECDRNNLPDGVSKVGDSLIVVPEYDVVNNSFKTSHKVSVAVGSKVSKGGADISKEIVGGDSKVYTTVGVGETVEFKLVADKAGLGSLSTPLSSFDVKDTYSKGLTINKDSIKVYYNSESSTPLVKDTDYSVSYDEANFKFSVSLEKSLAKEAFYTASSVVVTYNATLNAAAVVGNPGNPNKVDLTYKNYGASNYTDKPGNTVYVFTVALDVLKTDAFDATKVLSGAKFYLYNNVTAAKNATVDSTDYLAVATTGADGKANFVDKDGNVYKVNDDASYYLKEVVAPANYVLSTKVYEIPVDKAKYTQVGDAISVNIGVNGVVGTTITNTTIAPPHTGGIGTTIFTVSGLALIACAAVLLVVIKKKKITE